MTTTAAASASGECWWQMCRTVPRFMFMCLFRACSQYCQDPRTESDCIANIREFLRGCSSLKVEVSSVNANAQTQRCVDGPTSLFNY